MTATGIGTQETARRVKHFVHGAHRLAITSQSLADLLGLVEGECREALESLADSGALRRDVADSDATFYCKE